MNRLVVDRLWPLLVGLLVLVVGALALEEYARQRGNQEVVIEIRGEDALTPVDDEEGGEGVAGLAEGEAPLDELHARARVAARRAELKEALALYEQVLAAHPDSAEVHGEVGFWLLAAKQPRQALAHLERAKSLQPEVPRHALDLALARSRTGDLAGAERELRELLRLRPSYRSAQVALGGLLRKQGAHAEAIEVLRVAASSGGNEERARALVALGAAYLSAERREEAEKSFEQAILFAPARAEVRLGIARAWLSGGSREDQEKAMALLLRTAELAPDLAPVHAALGRAQERRGDEEAAEAAYTRALQLDPDYRYVRRRLLRLALGRRDYERARFEAQRLLRDAPEVPEHHFLAALVAERDGQLDEAREHYQAAIKQAGGGYPEAFLNLGRMEKGAGRPEQALEAYEQALRLRPDYLAAYNNLGSLYASTGRLAEAEATYRKAIELDASYSSAWYNLGELYKDQKRYAEAISAYQGALKARPGHAPTQLNLGVSYIRSGQREEALTTYRTLVAQHPRYVAAWYNMGLALEAGGQRAEAIEALRQALTLDSGHVPSLRKLAEFEVREGLLVEARRVYEELLDLRPADRGARVAHAEVLGLLGDRAGCEQRARALSAESPTDEQVRTLLGRCRAAKAAPPSSLLGRKTE